MSAELRTLFGALPRTTRGESVVIHGSTEKKTLLYTHANSVFIRNVEDPSKCDVYSEHSHPTTVAKYSPSGFYIASADTAGKIRIWDTVNPEHILKNEFEPFSGLVKDLDWSGDNQRMVAGGQGREVFSKAFNADTGTSLGDLTGHSKAVNSVAFKSNRPFRIVSGSEDYSVCYYEGGPPFKHGQTYNEHTNFVNCVRYAPDGSRFVSAGSDRTIKVYDGKTGEKTGELGDPAHDGGIYSLSFSPDSSELLSVSGDKTAKIWNIASGEMVCKFVMGSAIEDMQLGCLWLGDYLITVSLSGNINYLDRSNPTTSSRIIRGHAKNITGLAATESTIYASDAAGKIGIWNAETGVCEEPSGQGCKAMVKDISLCDGTLTFCGFDDTVRNMDTGSLSYGDLDVKMPSQPQGIASGSGVTVVACENDIVVIQGGNIVSTTKVNYVATSVSIHPGLGEVAVGGNKDQSVHIYSLSSGALSETQVLKQTGSITCVSYSPDGAYLASGNSNRKVVLYNCPDYSCKVSENWTAHGAKVLSVAWSPNSQCIASGGVDANVFVWSVNDVSKVIRIERAHKQSAVSSVCWRNDNIVVSGGHDSIIRQWNISH